MTIKVFCMNDFSEWWAGETLEACAAAAKEATGEDYPQEGWGDDEEVVNDYIESQRPAPQPQDKP